VVQFAPVSGDREGNLASIAAAAALLPDADLIVFPELALTGAVNSFQAAMEQAETVPGPATARLQEVATVAGAYLVAGLIERDPENGLLFNSAVLVGPEGVVGVYRKLHLTGEDRAWATPGNLGLPTFDISVGRIGMLLGYDALFPEAARILTLEGADIIACPSLLRGPAVLPYGATAVPMPEFVESGPTPAHFHLWRERERENLTHILFANGPAPWMGWSGCFAAALETEPRQESLVTGDGDGAATLEITTGGEVRMKSMVGMRVPIWYDALQAPQAMAARVAQRRGARPEAWLNPVPSLAQSGIF
jgi:hypothetical protein